MADTSFSLGFTSDGKYLASSGASAYRVKEDATGRRIAYAYDEIKLWTVESGLLACELKAGQEETGGASIALSRDGRLLASMHREGIRIWKLPTGQLIRTIFGCSRHLSRTHAIAFSPDSRLLAAISRGCTVMLWDVATGERRLSFDASHEAAVSTVACSPNRRLIATGARDGTVRLWDRQTGQQLHVLQLGESPPSSVASVTFSPDGSTLAACGYDGSSDRRHRGMIRIWNVTTGEVVLGSRQTPRLSAAQVLVGAPQPKDERGIRARVCVADWNGDGRLDLIVGDHGTAFDKTLSEEEKSFRDETRRAQTELLRAWAQVFRRYRELQAKSSAASGNTKREDEEQLHFVREELGRLNRARNRFFEQEQALMPGKQYHGRVWLYLGDRNLSRSAK